MTLTDLAAVSELIHRDAMRKALADIEREMWSAE